MLIKHKCSLFKILILNLLMIIILLLNNKNYKNSNKNKILEIIMIFYKIFNKLLYIFQAKKLEIKKNLIKIHKYL